MAAKLKSIIRQIHWSSSLKALAFAVAWFYFPWWIFLPVALYCYLVPSFQAGKFALSFAVLILIALVTPQGALMAIALGAIFYYLLLIKDLLVIDRVTGRALLVMALSFFLFRQFYADDVHGPVGVALTAAMFVAALFGWLVYDLISAAHAGHKATPHVRTIAGWLSFLVMAQCLIVGLFLPIDFVYQSVIVFLVAVVFINVVPEHLAGTLSFAKIRMTCVTLFVLFVVSLSAARWGL